MKKLKKNFKTDHLNVEAMYDSCEDGCSCSTVTCTCGALDPSLNYANHISVQSHHFSAYNQAGF